MADPATPTPQDYIDALPPERQAVITAMRQLLLRSLPPGYEESLAWGMLSYVIPLARYPKTYNGQPLMYAALAAQKHYCSLYLMCVYQSPEKERWLRQEFSKAGKKLDMGKSCLHFRSLADLPLEAIAQVIAGTPPDQFIAAYESIKRKK
jgi:hypothetical protein